MFGKSVLVGIKAAGPEKYRQNATSQSVILQTYNIQESTHNSNY